MFVSKKEEKRKKKDKVSYSHQVRVRSDGRNLQVHVVLSKSSSPAICVNAVVSPDRYFTPSSKKLRKSTFHAEFNSNPGGAIGLSVWPRILPVKRRSRSITSHMSVSVRINHPRRRERV